MWDFERRTSYHPCWDEVRNIRTLGLVEDMIADLGGVQVLNVLYFVKLEVGDFDVDAGQIKEIH